MKRQNIQKEQMYWKYAKFFPSE